MKIITTRIVKLLGVAWIVTLLPVHYVHATPPLPLNGKIVFVSNRDGDTDLYLMNPDGSEQTALTSNSVHDDFPTWSPDGRTIAFVKADGGAYSISVMNADGTNIREIMTLHPGGDPSRFGMSWSPDGSKIALQASTDIVVINADGSGRVNLTNGQFINSEPSWSPDGSRIAFGRSIYSHGYYAGIWVMNADGSNPMQIFSCSCYGMSISPDWSPDGSRIAFTLNGDLGSDDIWKTTLVDPDGTNLQLIGPDGPEHPRWAPDATKIIFSGPDSQIRVINRDGSGLTQLTSAFGNYNPDWQPLRQAATLSGRVVTPDGRGLRNAAVILTDPQGVTLTVTTSSFGYYSFDNVATGTSYTITATSKRYRFASQTVSVSGNLTNINFVGLE